MVEEAAAFDAEHADSAAGVEVECSGVGDLRYVSIMNNLDA